MKSSLVVKKQSPYKIVVVVEETVTRQATYVFNPEPGTTKQEAMEEAEFRVQSDATVVPAEVQELTYQVNRILSCQAVKVDDSASL